jgi:hypothetical protein
MASPTSRYLHTARRATLARSALLGALIVSPGLACGNDDAAVFASSTTVAATDPATAGSDTTAAAASSDTTAAAGTDTTAAATSGALFPSGAELAVSFSFTPTSTDRVRNPYIAVWVEDTSGNLVKTISLWYQSGKGDRWLSDLQQWASTSGEAVDESTSGATRSAGDYTVVWDGTDANGNPVAQGEYVLFIEAAREHGPYELISQDITISDAGFDVTMSDNGELTGASARLSV